MKIVNHPHDVGESDDNSVSAAISCGADPRTVVATGVGATGTTVSSATVGSMADNGATSSPMGTICPRFLKPQFNSLRAASSLGSRMPIRLTIKVVLPRWAAPMKVRPAWLVYPGLYSDGSAIVLHQIVLVIDGDGLSFFSVLFWVARVGELGALGAGVRQEIVAGDRGSTDQGEVVRGRKLTLGVQAAGVLAGVVGLQIAGHLVHLGHSGADRRVSLGEGDRRVVAAGKQQPGEQFIDRVLPTNPDPRLAAVGVSWARAVPIHVASGSNCGSRVNAVSVFSVLAGRRVLCGFFAARTSPVVASASSQVRALTCGSVAAPALRSATAPRLPS